MPFEKGHPPYTFKGIKHRPHPKDWNKEGRERKRKRTLIKQYGSWKNANQVLVAHAWESRRRKYGENGTSRKGVLGMRKANKKNKPWKKTKKLMQTPYWKRVVGPKIKKAKRKEHRCIKRLGRKYKLYHPLAVCDSLGVKGRTLYLLEVKVGHDTPTETQKEFLNLSRKLKRFKYKVVYFS